MEDQEKSVVFQWYSRVSKLKAASRVNVVTYGEQRERATGWRWDGPLDYGSIG